MSKPCVSVVIPCYNSEKYLAQAIDSALCQTYPNVEVIVVDDASTDESLAVAKQYGDKIKLLANERNMERSWSRNRGIAAAKGDFIAFLDADDVLLPDSIEKRIAFAQAHPDVGLIYGKAQYIDEDGDPDETPHTGICGWPPLHGSLHIVPAGESALIVENWIPCMTVMLPKDVFVSSGGFDTTPWMQGVEDYDLWLRISETHSIAYLDVELALYRRHARQTTADPLVSLRAYIKLKKHHLKHTRKYRRMYDRSLIWRDACLGAEKRLKACLWFSRRYDSALKLGWMWSRLKPYSFLPYYYSFKAFAKAVLRFSGGREERDPVHTLKKH